MDSVAREALESGLQQLRSQRHWEFTFAISIIYYEFRFVKRGYLVDFFLLQRVAAAFLAISSLFFLVSLAALA